ncbi:MAG TPA: type II CAAX endopeptidase family protein [Bryobacteraceae bacterium]|nr:type II CAAX endopeptidase family protein [Bryobacteraceae bacterium]
MAFAVLPAFLIEAVFYLMPGFESVRKAFDSFGAKPLRALLLATFALIPYLVEAPRTGTFRLSSFVALLAVVVVAAFWYAWIRPSLPADLLFLAFLAAVYLSKLLDQIYGQPATHVNLAILGKLMWIRLSIMAVLSLRSLPNPRFGFVPSRSEWRIGILFYAIFLPVGAVIAYLLNFAHFRTLALDWWKLALLAPAMFFGFLWVVAVFEEFFFRGFLQRVLGDATGSEIIGLVLASVLFGLAHLWFGHRFPNWRFAILGAVSGVFYGLAFLRAASVRAGMVTHALVVTTWRLFFS